MKAMNDSPERMKETLSQANSLSHHSNLQPLPPPDMFVSLSLCLHYFNPILSLIDILLPFER